MINISGHAYLRCEERLGWTKPTVDKMVNLIYDRNIECDEQAMAYVKTKIRKGWEFRIHSGLLFLFKKYRLVTVLMFHPRYRKHLDMLSTLAEI